MLLLNATGTHGEDQNDEVGTGTRSALTTEILESAYTHQQMASNKRIGVGPSKSTSASGPPGLSQFKNLSKAKAVIEKRKTKKAEAHLRDIGIRVVATVWMSDKNKLSQVSMISWAMGYQDLTSDRLDKSGCRVSMSQLLG